MTTCASRMFAGGALVAALALTGCSGGDSTAADNRSAAPAAPSSTPTGGSPSASGSDSTTGELAAEAAKAGIDPANPPKPIVSATAPAVVEGDPKASMKVDLLGLKRQGKTLLASYAFTVTSPAGVDKADWLYDYLGGHGWDPSLVDTKNLMLHRVVTAQNRRVATNFQGAEFRPGQTFYAYAVFGAPPEDVTTMDVVASDGIPAFPGVPIS